MKRKFLPRLFILPLIAIAHFIAMPLHVGAITAPPKSFLSEVTTTDIDTIKDPALSSDASCNKTQCSIVSNYINPFIKLLTILVGIAITIGVIVGAIQVISSAGDPQQAASGKNHIRNALFAAVGYVLLLALLQWLLPGGVA